MNHRNLLHVSAGIILSVAGISAALPAPRQHRFVNLKILPKDISEEKLDSIMHNFNFSLGVRCGFCHAKNDSTKHLDFPSDEKPEKNIARNMMLMTNDINKRYFNFNDEVEVPQTVMCITCHWQNPRPQADSSVHLLKTQQTFDFMPKGRN